MPGYANRKIYLGFPELTEDGDHEVHVIIKNPKVVPLEELQSADVALGPDGQPDEVSARAEMYRIVAGLVLVGHVYDATCFDDDQQPMNLPISAQDAARLPWQIIKKVTEQVKDVLNPS
jgi:hypothetical protein